MDSNQVEGDSVERSGQRPEAAVEGSLSSCSLAEQGFRFVYRRGEFNWVHPLEKRATDRDCTDMSDAEFVAFVLEPA